MALPAIAGRALFLGGGLVGNVIGGALSGAGSAIGGIAEGAGRAVQGVGSAIGGALQGALTPAPKVVVNNVGMVGEAAKKKVTGRGTIPAPKKTATPNVNANMPTEKLLNVAVKYLVSIDKTLQEQIKFERLAYQQQAQAEREAAIEASPKGPGIFSKLGEKFGALKEYGSEVAGRASLLTKALIAGLGIAGLATLGISQLDTSELERLKANWEAFKEKFGWLGEMASLVSNGTTVLGYVFRGWKGAIVGTVLNWLSENLTGQSLISFLFGGDPAAADATSTAAGGGMTGGAGDTLLTAGMAGYGAYRVGKTYKDVRARMNTMAQQRARPRVDPTLKGSGFRDPKTGRAASRAAVAAGGGWLSSSMGQKFVAFLQRRYGKSWVAKVVRLMGRVFVGVAMTATGVAAIPGILWTLVNVGLSLYTVYELLDAWWDFQDEEESKKDAAAVNAGTPKNDDATPAAGGGSSTAPGIVAPMASSAAGQDATPLPPAASGPIDAILDKTPQQLTDAELRQLVELQGRIENPSGSLNNPGGLPVSSARTTPYANNVIGDVGANGAPQVRIAKFDTAENGIRAAMWLWRNGSRYRGKSVRDGLGAWSTGHDGRNPNYERMLGSARPGWTGNPNIQPGFGGGAAGSLSSIAQSLADMGQGVIKGVGSIIKTGMGDYAPRSITPIAASMNKPSEIAKLSSNIQNEIDLGKDKSTSSAPGVSDMVAAAYRSVQNASPDGKLAAIDPNWPGSDGSVEAYLQYYKLAA